LDVGIWSFSHVRNVNLTIREVAFGGKGVGRSDGKAVFVPFTIDGESISARIVREKKQFAEAEVVEVKQNSSHRVTPECPYFGRCGGCSYQHIDYLHQLEIKSRQVNDVLQRIGKIKDIPFRPIIPSPLTYAYRNRITVHARDRMVGYFRRDSHDLIDVEHCPIAMAEVNRGLEELRGSKPADGHYTLRAQTGPRIFSQTNDGVAQALRDLVVDLIPSGQDLLIDAFCGAGFFAKALLDKFQRIIGIDWDRFAIEAARKDGTEKETYIAGDIEEEIASVNLTALSGQVSKSKMKNTANTTLIVDPPATGLSATLRKTIVELAPTTLIYVSCNPATVVRDLGDLRQRFEIESVTPLDMFPQTAEIEVVVSLRGL
jgi:tRNA/tmRNA/rRNA uracil-C5-methylase (TrmA/RlmC/RlmD family)